MLSQLISRLIARQIDRGILKQEEREAYEYGYFLIALEILNISIMVLIGILFKCFFPLLFFTLCLIALRKYAGGVHASSYTRCAAASALLELILVLILRSRLWRLLFLPAVLPAVCGCAVIWVCSPVAASKKPLTDGETLLFRKRSHDRLLFEVILAVLLFLSHNYLLCFVVMFNFITIGSAMGIALWQRRRA